MRRDISLGNLMLQEGGSKPTPRGLLIDLDLSIPAADVKQPASKELIVCFMFLGAL